MRDDLEEKMSASSSEEYEKQIVEIVSDLGHTLGIKVHPNRVVWHGRLVATPNFMTGLGSDQCDFDGGKVILPKTLKDRLTPEEWRPLLASQLLYERRSKLAIFSRWILLIIIVRIVWVGAVASLGASYGDYGLALALALFIPITILATWFFSHELRGVRLKADERAARLVGPREFLNVLEKVDSFKINDVEKRKRGGFRIRVQSHFPSIDSRIRRMNKLAEPIIPASFSPKRA